MKTLTFSQIDKIQDFQYLTDSSGLLLDSDGYLYQFNGNTTELIETPKDFKISHFHFIDKNHGAIIGNGGVIEKEVQEASIGGSGLISVLILLLLFSVKIKKSGQKKTLYLFFVLAISCLAISCSNSWQMYKTQDPNSKYVTFITNNQLAPGSGFHSYVANKGQTSFISITKDGGKNWKTQKVPTNFYLTALTALGNNFVVGTFANEQTSNARPYHGDGDIYFYGNDTLHSNKLANNTNPASPYSINVQRGVKGFTHATQESLLYVFGSETEPQFPKDEVSTTPGNIYQIPTSLNPNYRIIDVPDSLVVKSLSISKSGDLWVTLDDKKKCVTKGYITFVSVDRKKMLHFKDGNWTDATVGGAKSFEQVEFISGTDTGYALTESGEVYKTVSNGADWELIELLKGVQIMHTFDNSMTFMKDKNKLMLIK